MAGSSISASAPSALASLAKRTARGVVISDTPTTTGTRPATTSTAALSTSRFSSGSSELFSPQVPSTISPCTPSRTSASSTPCVAARSIDRSAANCVVAAG